jgi:AcrR family transcriptional regulator
MPKGSSEPARTRRRGPELEAALLDAAWEELAAVGYARLTMESVAARAHTGVAVLYRRWANKDELVLTAIENYGRVHPIELPDTGTLRGDLIAVLTAFSKARAGFIAIAATSAFSGLMADSGLTPVQVRERLIGDQPSRRDAIYQRAQERGEIDLDRMSPAALSMPVDLVRHDLLMNLKPLKRARIEAIVDDVFLPLAARSTQTPRRRGTSASPTSTGRPRSASSG